MDRAFYERMLPPEFRRRDATESRAFANWMRNFSNIVVDTLDVNPSIRDSQRRADVRGVMEAVFDTMYDTPVFLQSDEHAERNMGLDFIVMKEEVLRRITAMWTPVRLPPRQHASASAALPVVESTARDGPPINMLSRFF